jgi:hypothetical protein
MSNLIFEDKPCYDAGMKMILSVAPVILLAQAVQVYLTEGLAEAKAVAMPLVIIFLIYLFVLPRRYQVMDDGIKILLGRPFSIGYSYGAISEVTRQGRHYFGINLATAISSNRSVYVLRDRGMRVAITPCDPDAFVRAASQAMESWKRTGIAK